MAFPTINYGGTTGAPQLDGEGRFSGVTASSGTSPLTSATYVTSGTSEPIGALTNATFGSGDSDSFTYDPNTGRMTQYAFTVGASPQTLTGSLTWNPNGTLGSLAIVDPFNSSDSQTCSYGYDDLVRASAVSCGTTWAQTFSYDPFGNISKSGSSSWLPNYTNSNNQYVQGWNGANYDSNGNLLNDTFNNYTWDSYGNLASANSNAIVYDAFDRMVENTKGGVKYQFVYSPGGGQPLAVMSGQTLSYGYVALPGGAFAMYNSSGLFQYNHPDWLGSARLFSTPSRGASPAMAYAPFGEGYAGGQQWIQFTSAGNAWTVAYNENQTGSLEDFMFRRYSPSQSRWISPDPAGLAAVDPTNPQTWNRYAYVTNSPLSFVDPLGLLLEGPHNNNCQPTANGWSYTCGGCPMNTLCVGGGGGGGGIPDLTGYVFGYWEDDTWNTTNIILYGQGQDGGQQIDDPSNVFGGGKNQSPKPWKVHGNWCGPNWTGGKAGEYDPAIDKAGGYSPPQDALDTACMQHDMCYYQCRQEYPCDPAGRSQCFATACDGPLGAAAHSLPVSWDSTRIDILFNLRATDLPPFQPNPYPNATGCQQ